MVRQRSYENKKLALNKKNEPIQFPEMNKIKIFTN
jgi:hypothetical protein